jgi:hypothetical protein
VIWPHRVARASLDLQDAPSKGDISMKTQLCLIAAFVLASSALQGADVKAATGVDAAAAFARLKTLVGEWEGDNTGMGKAHLSYELIAAGTALVERETSEKMPAMVTVYHLDVSRLLLTLYCAAGNQPRMQATNFAPETGELEFQFLDATNLTTPDAGHMHNAHLRFVDKDHFEAEWQFYTNGQPKQTETAKYSRVK